MATTLGGRLSASWALFGILALAAVLFQSPMESQAVGVEADHPSADGALYGEASASVGEVGREARAAVPRPWPTQRQHAPWGVIAFYSVTDSWMAGATANYVSAHDAEWDARQQCGGESCYVAETLNDECGALAVSVPLEVFATVFVGSAKAGTEGRARVAALAKCQEYAEGFAVERTPCAVEISICSGRVGGTEPVAIRREGADSTAALESEAAPTVPAGANSPPWGPPNAAALPRRGRVEIPNPDRVDLPATDPFDAIYKWGELFFGEGRVVHARRVFETIIRDFAGTDGEADAWYALSLIFAREGGSSSELRRALEFIADTFPETMAARLAGIDLARGELDAGKPNVRSVGRDSIEWSACLNEHAYPNASDDLLFVIESECSELAFVRFCLRPHRIYYGCGYEICSRVSEPSCMNAFVEPGKDAFVGRVDAVVERVEPIGKRTVWQACAGDRDKPPDAHPCYFEP